ncbi:MAG TPA: hypothetical protein EYP04_13470, partial [Anaerolineae bacterium]|nr:hypothetical protein [Anaerolineae bacterium]
METTPPEPILPGLTRLLEGKVSSRIINFILIPALLILCLALPPISLFERVSSIGTELITLEHRAVVDPDGTQVTFSVQGLETDNARARLYSIPRELFIAGDAGKKWLPAAEALPNYLIPKSPLYVLEVKHGHPEGATLTVPIPNDAEPYETLDLHSWDPDAGEWKWLPSHVIIEDDV